VSQDKKYLEALTIEQDNPLGSLCCQSFMTCLQSVLGLWIFAPEAKLQDCIPLQIRKIVLNCFKFVHKEAL
jgi:hypothetical protein